MVKNPNLKITLNVDFAFLGLPTHSWKLWSKVSKCLQAWGSMSLSFTSCRVLEPDFSTSVNPQPATRHILPGRMKLNWGGMGIVPTARVRLAFSFNCEGNERLSVLEIC